MKETSHLGTKLLVVLALVVVLTGMHYVTGGHNVDLHLFHRELFFIPIMLAAFWFGIKGGAITATVSIILYIPRLAGMEGHLTWSTLGFQAVVFLIVGVLLGWLSDKQRRQRQAALDAERQAVVGRAATAVAGEMAEILGALRHMAAEKPENLGTDPDFRAELDRLQNLVESLSTYAPASTKRLSTDINALISEQVARYAEAAKRASVRLWPHLDEKGCPIYVDAEQLRDTVAALIENAIQASPPGKTVEISSQRKGECCEVSVTDQGPGIKPEHRAKIFTPFFTTKPGGSGLALAAARKVIQGMGGKINVESTPGEGATFSISIPRENREGGC